MCIVCEWSASDTEKPLKLQAIAHSVSFYYFFKENALDLTHFFVYPLEN